METKFSVSFYILIVKQSFYKRDDNFLNAYCHIRMELNEPKWKSRTEQSEMNDLQWTNGNEQIEVNEWKWTIGTELPSIDMIILFCSHFSMLMN